MRRFLLAFAAVALGAAPAVAQTGDTGPTPPGISPVWQVVMYVLLGILVLGLLAWAFAALNRRRGAGETGVEGPPPQSDEGATPGPTPSDGRYGTQR